MGIWAMAVLMMATAAVALEDFLPGLPFHNSSSALTPNASHSPNYTLLLTSTTTLPTPHQNSRNNSSSADARHISETLVLLELTAPAAPISTLRRRRRRRPEKKEPSQILVLVIGCCLLALVTTLFLALAFYTRKRARSGSYTLHHSLCHHNPATLTRHSHHPTSPAPPTNPVFPTFRTVWQEFEPEESTQTHTSPIPSSYPTTDSAISSNPYSIPSPSNSNSNLIKSTVTPGPDPVTRTKMADVLRELRASFPIPQS